MKTLFKLFFAIASVLFMATAISQAQPVAPVQVAEVIFIAGAAVGFVRFLFLIATPFARHNRATGLALAVTFEIWEDFIASNLFKSYQWILRAKDRTARVINGSIVHIPQAGTVVSTRRNRSVYPVPLVKRSDNDITYTIDEISSEATHIKNAETVELSYDKINDVLGDHVNQIGRDVARNAMFRWLASLNAANINRSTGADTAVYISTQTGTRKKYMAADLATGKTTMINQTKRESGNRIAVMSEGAYNQIKSDSIVTAKETMDSVGAVWKDGVLVRLHGFDIIRTDVMPLFTNASPPVAKDPLDESVATAVTDNDVIALLDLSFVHCAKGDVKFFETLQDALLQGDAYSALVRCGFARERNDQAGVVAVVQIA